MERKHGFLKMDLSEFKIYLDQLRIGRTVLRIQQHHTYIPSYLHFDGSNHFEKQLGMKNSHIQNGWSDIGQHFTIFPDGLILTGRSLEMAPAGIFGQNLHAICLENFGFFDKGKDGMRKEQADAIVAVTALLCERFAIPVDTQGIIYHHWFDLNTGTRNNGTKNNKSCPGTAFFGGNKTSDCEQYFLPLVKAKLNDWIPVKTEPLYYTAVTTSGLKIRIQPHARSLPVVDRENLVVGSILRVYAEKEGWVKISASADHWVNARYTTKVRPYQITANSLNIRTGPSIEYPKVGHFTKGEIVFISREENGWSKISLEDQWVKSSYLAPID